MSVKLNEFLKQNNFNAIDVPSLTNDLLLDMKDGLASASLADEPMIVASSKLPNPLVPGSRTIVIDAGGTNFRSCLVTVSGDGDFIISNLEKTKMPGIEKELSKEEFYDAIAANLDHLKDQATRIGFCFSYAMEITKDGDGKVLVFSKEIKAPQAVGTYVGAELKKALLARGWKDIQKITLLNDTMASLLGGFVHAQEARNNYSSYIGFILGTGINNAYIEYDTIAKLSDNSKPHIVVCECGMYNKVPQSNFDSKVDLASTNPGSSLLEKMCSGAYLGSVAFYALKEACACKLFTDGFCQAFSKIDSLTPYDIDVYYNSKKDIHNKLGSLIPSSTKGDIKLMEELLQKIIERAAQIVASVLSASVLKSTKGTNKKEPVCIVGNGTTFWKTHGLYKKLTGLLNKNLSGKNKRYYEIVKIENDITLGASAAAFL